MTEKYESKQQQILKPAEVIYGVMSDFNNFTPMVADKVEGWMVDGDQCSFKVKGFKMTLRMTEKIAGRLVKIEASDDSPFGFSFWLQMKQVEPYDTRIKLVLHAEMNTMIKMMIGKKIQPALDNMVEQMAQMFNAI